LEFAMTFLEVMISVAISYYTVCHK